MQPIEINKINDRSISIYAQDLGELFDILFLKILGEVYLNRNMIILSEVLNKDKVPFNFSICDDYETLFHRRIAIKKKYFSFLNFKRYKTYSLSFVRPCTFIDIENIVKRNLLTTS